MTVRKPLRKGRVRIDLFGAPRIERGGVSIAPDTRKALALVAYLAVTKRAQARDRLAALLWPEADAERARGALRRTLSSLRTALGGEHLVTDGHRVALDEDVDCDVTRFRALAAEGRLGEAAEAYAGDFLAGFSLRGEALEFEEWQLAEADALRRELSGVLERLAQQDADPERAIAAAKRWVAIDPLHEPAHRALMRLYARAGDRSAALRQYRECARQLDRELGVSPLPETVALRGAIEQGELEPAPRPPATGVHERVGDLYTLHGDYPEAIASYQAALAESTPAARPAIAHKLADVHHRRGDWEQAERHYREALRDDDDVARRARVTADWSLAAHRRGDPARATRLAEEALRLAERADDDRALAQAHNMLGILRRDATHFERSLAIAERIGHSEARVAALNNLALAAARAGERERAVRLTEDALTLSASIGDRHREAALHNNLADLLHEAGHKGAAMRHLKRAVALFAEIDEPDAREPEVWKLVEW
ncbi:MAG TPA: BTAD domain-containing putative transcriptional regulator [Candidatus Limnocylindria bacterium]